MINVSFENVSGPDEDGRYRFMVLWEDLNGIFRHEEHPGGGPVGYRRGQSFNMDPKKLRPELADAFINHNNQST